MTVSYTHLDVYKRQAVGGVTKEQVVKAAQTVSLDTVYQLTGKEEA